MPHHGGVSVPYDDPLHHCNAYAGYDATKRRFTNYFYLRPGTENADYQAAWDYLAATYGGGTLGHDGGVPIDTANLITPALTTDLIIIGNGHRKGAGTLAQARESRSYLEFQNGFRIVNTLAAENNGRVIFRDLALIWNGLVNNPGFDTEFQPFGIENCLITEFNCTLTDYTDALIGCTATPAPEAGMSWIKDSDIGLHSENAVGIFVHKEMMYVDNTIISFEAANQVGWMVSHPDLPPGHGFNVVGHLEVWMGADAEGCAVFRVFNAEKCVGIDSIVAATQAGAGNVTANVIFGLRAGQAWVTVVPAYVVTKGIDGPFLWGQAPAVGNYLWEDGDAQERTSFVAGSQFGGVLIPGPIVHDFYVTRNPALQGPPNVAYVAFDTDLTRLIDMTNVVQARVRLRSQGNEAGADKGFCIYNITDAAILCEHEWDGAAIELAEGAWTNVVVTGQKELQVRYKGSSATENLNLSFIELERR